MKTWPSAILAAAALMILPLAITGCDRKTETKVVKEAAPAQAPVHDTTIIREQAPVVHDTTVIKEDQTIRETDHDHDNH